MEPYQYILLAVIAIWNIVTFALYGIDKAKAKARAWRISEATLITVAFLMGAIGALLGMNVFRHKTNHIKFKLLVPLALIFNIGVTVIYILFLMN